MQLKSAPASPAPCDPRQLDLAIGGQAVIEGVMMRSPTAVATAVRNAAGRIVVRKRPFRSIVRRVPALGVPVLRGGVHLVESLGIGLGALTFAADQAADDGPVAQARPRKPGETLLMWGTLVLSFALGLGLFFYLPLVLTGLLGIEHSLWFNLVDGLFRIVIFVAYLWGISRLPDMARVFQYHGAEHKTIHAFENGRELTPAGARPFTTLHPRCGTSFLFFVMLISVVVFVFLGRPDTVGARLLRLAFVPLISGLAYEAIKLSGRFRGAPALKPLIWPGLMLQRITTNEPDDTQLEVAMAALRAVLAPEEADFRETTWEEPGEASAPPSELRTGGGAVRGIIENLQAQSHELEGRLGDPAVLKDQTQYRVLTREHARLKGILAIGERWLVLNGRVQEDRQVLQTERDPELIQLVREELPDLEQGLAEATAELEVALLPHDPIDDRDVILEVRAGTGGDEAALFAEEIARMYVRHAERRGWKVEPLEGTPGQAGGMKEVIYAVRGEGVYGILRWESGVHRVQRVPLTESQGRIHTSAVTVAVLPEADEVDVQIRPEELRIDVFRARGPGGQSVNTTDSAVRVTHLPTGLVVSCQDEKSQHKNKAKAMQVLRARLLEKAISEQEAAIAAERRSQVGSGDRSAKIRTYNFPQDRLTDHRIGLTVHNLEAIMAGELDSIVAAIQTYRREQALQTRRTGS